MYTKSSSLKTFSSRSWRTCSRHDSAFNASIPDTGSLRDDLVAGSRSWYLELARLMDEDAELGDALPPRTDPPPASGRTMTHQAPHKSGRQQARDGTDIPSGRCHRPICAGDCAPGCWRSTRSWRSPTTPSRNGNGSARASPPSRSAGSWSPCSRGPLRRPSAPVGTAGPYGDVSGGECCGGQGRGCRRGRPVEDVRRA